MVKICVTTQPLVRAVCRSLIGRRAAGVARASLPTDAGQSARWSGCSPNSCQPALRSAPARSCSPSRCWSHSRRRVAAGVSRDDGEDLRHQQPLVRAGSSHTDGRCAARVTRRHCRLDTGRRRHAGRVAAQIASSRHSAEHWQQSCSPSRCWSHRPWPCCRRRRSPMMVKICVTTQPLVVARPSDYDGRWRCTCHSRSLPTDAGRSRHAGRIAAQIRASRHSAQHGQSRVRPSRCWSHKLWPCCRRRRSPTMVKICVTRQPLVVSRSVTTAVAALQCRSPSLRE